MVSQESGNKEYVFDERNQAETMAFFTNRIIHFDEESGKYELLTKSELNNIIKQKYEEDDYVGAERLLEEAPAVSLKEYKKGLDELTAKSMRLPMHDYLKLLKEAFIKEISVADVAKTNVLDDIKNKLQILKQKKTIDSKRINEVINKINDWQALKPKTNREYYALPCPLWLGDLETHIPDEEVLEAIDKIIKYFKSKTDDTIDWDIYSFFEQNFKGPSQEYWEYISIADSISMGLILNKQTKNMELQFTWNLDLEMKTNPAQCMLDLAKLKEESIEKIVKTSWLKEAIIAGKEYTDSPDEFLRYIESSMREQGYHIDNIFGEEDKWEEFFYHPISLTFDLTYDNDKIYFAGIEVSEDNISLMNEVIFKTLITDDIAKINPSKRKQQLIKMVEEDANPEDIKEAQKKLVIRQNAKTFSEYIGSIIYSSLNDSQVITYTLPKTIMKTADIFYDTKILKNIVSSQG